MDVLGKRSLKKGARWLGLRPSHGKRLHRQALVARPSTALLTVAWYLIGGLAAARATRSLIAE